MTKSAHTRASLLPYPIIAAAVAGDAEAVSRVVRHYSIVNDNNKFTM